MPFRWDNFECFGPNSLMVIFPPIFHQNCSVFSANFGAFMTNISISFAGDVFAISKVTRVSILSKDIKISGWPRCTGKLFYKHEMRGLPSFGFNFGFWSALSFGKLCQIYRVAALANILFWQQFWNLLCSWSWPPTLPLTNTTIWNLKEGESETNQTV